MRESPYPRLPCHRVVAGRIVERVSYHDTAGPAAAAWRELTLLLVLFRGLEVLGARPVDDLAEDRVQCFAQVRS